MIFRFSTVIWNFSALLIPSKHLTTETNPQPQCVHLLVIVREDTAVQTRTASAFSTRIYNMLMEDMWMAAGEHVCVCTCLWSPWLPLFRSHPPCYQTGSPAGLGMPTLFFKLHFIYLFCVCEWTGGDMCAMHTSGGQRMTFRT